MTRVRATGPLRDGDRVTGAVVEDRLSGATLEVRAAAVLDATGVWGALPDRPFGGGGFSVLPSRGSHLVVPARPDPGERRDDAADPRPRRVPRPVAAATG